jgi:NAD(P)-dependent dehydrogenase (short-subunit alcohol dehydrogenase family)
MPTLLITGSNRGLGLGVAGKIAAAGWHVHACCRDPATATELRGISEAAAGRLTIHALDIRDFDAVRALAGTLKGKAIDILLNNAGIMEPRQSSFDREDLSQNFGHVNYEDWMTVLRVNLLGTAYMAECFVEHVAQSERKIIANMSSSLGSLEKNVFGGWYAYRTSKTAINMLTRNLAHDLAPRGITAVALHPGWVRTDMGGPKAEISPEESTSGLTEVLLNLTPSQSGRFIAWDGSEVPW